MATQTAVGGSVVVGIAVSGIASCWVAGPAIVVCTDCDCRADQRYSNQGRCCSILVPHHFRTLIELHTPPAEFFGEVLLECWILALQVSAAERRLIDRLWIGVECLARCGACAQGTRNEQGAEHPQIYNCQESPQ